MDMEQTGNITQWPIFFAPGCKLLQLEPDTVSRLYDYLHRLFGNIHLYTRCCGLDDARQHDEEAVFITLCPSCFKVYGDTYANLHMRDFWSVYEDYKDLFPLDDAEKLHHTISSAMSGAFPKKGLHTWYNSLDLKEK